jgi:YVTN family beta-propeller protein
MKKALILLLFLGTIPAFAQVKPIEKIKVSKGPYFANLSSDGSLLYVTSFADSEIEAIDTNTLEVRKSFYGGYEPVGIADTPSGNKLFITNLSPGLVKVVNPANYEILDDVKVGGRPANVVIASNGLQAFILNFGRGKIGRVDFVDTSTHRVIGGIDIGVRPVAGAASPLGDQLFVACSGSNDLYVIDVIRRELVKRIPVGLAPDGMAISPDGLKLYVANSSTNDISVVDLIDLKEVRRAPVGSKPFSMAVVPDGRILVVETGDKMVSLYTPDFKKVQSFKAEKKPVDVVLSRDGKRIFVTDEKDNRVLVYQMP